jgi:hypothetical protein
MGSGAKDEAVRGGHTREQGVGGTGKSGGRWENKATGELWALRTIEQ